MIDFLIGEYKSRDFIFVIPLAG